MNSKNLKYIVQFQQYLEKLNWDDFMTIYKIRDRYDKDEQELLATEYAKRALNFNQYMSF